MHRVFSMDRQMKWTKRPDNHTNYAQAASIHRAPKIFLNFICTIILPCSHIRITQQFLWLWVFAFMLRNKHRAQRDISPHKLGAQDPGLQGTLWPFHFLLHTHALIHITNSIKLGRSFLLFSNLRFPAKIKCILLTLQYRSHFSVLGNKRSSVQGKQAIQVAKSFLVFSESAFSKHQSSGL